MHDPDLAVEPTPPAAPAGRPAARAGRLWGVPALAALALATAGCGYLEDRLKTCEDTFVTLLNSSQTRSAYHLLADGERATSETLLPSGASRRVTQCLRKGVRQHFRVQAEGDGQPLAVVDCVAQRASYESARPQVIWTQVGFQCQGW